MNMLIAAIVLSIAGFVFLVLSLSSTGEIWEWLLFVTVVLGMMLLFIDIVKKRGKRGSGGKHSAK
ncbi:Hypothetical protein Cp1002B_1272 [Corynebacterium pseudotuberculosis]|nr:Hypothetical protein CpPAT10_1382 [Corynebacterium pseudotuberculosis PAT10]AFF22539.1 Hypothetical protein CpP54B96_1406 [Corynebacterium pseudotuberculosis P54B96]AFH52338.1 Hypothetical protein Cp267_1441 [Corynebacterium pseudotuberculosis 267]AJC14121.1 Hypothetical protein CpVD57_1412 [Corynebacterium pseudotuberculosis]AKC74150.1 Hypothetical protein Cp226_1437 [Corynebacterium pseudotuberculosis]